MVTIRKLAELAGVSRGTVDRVVNARGKVEKALERRILALVREHGYRPNRVAKALSHRKRRYAIGAISPSRENIFFNEVCRGVFTAEEELKDFGISLVYHEFTRFCAAEQLGYLGEMLRRKVDGLIVNPINDPEVVRMLQEVNRRRIPVITFNSDIDNVERLAYIGCDHRKSGHIAAGLFGFLCSRPTRLAIVIGSRHSPGHSLRVEGFVEEAGRYPAITVGDVVEMKDDEDISRRKVKSLLRRRPDVEAIYFAAGGKRGGIEAVREAGRAGEMKLVTMDLDPLTVECLENGLVSATICQQPYVQGYEAVKQLAQYIMYGEVPARSVQYTQAEIMIRQSL